MSEFKLGAEKAKIYSLGKSSSDVFRKAHEQDFLNGYNQALQDCKTVETLKELTETITDLKILRNQINSEVKNNHLFEGMPELMDKWIERKEQLIKKATE